MKDIILKAENISKQYRLGLVGTGTLSHDLNRWWHRIRGKQDPYLKLGESNDRETKGESNYVWALKEINFEVQRGEVLGIIGKNGAGKSTLLKILSKVTGPTTGSVKTKGRIASLLEVGTGFHPELTGKENIFLNGAILGMTKVEINSKIDEIVSFSGCERYIDTPVKRYSSGMKVRLAFAVAAHLEPEILVVDEVLAVGDAEFQKKAIGKMQDISKGEGRTVLFVSHNMAAVKSLCTRGIVLDNGQIAFEGDTNECIDKYLKLDSKEGNSFVKEYTKESREGKSEWADLISVGVRAIDKEYGEPITTKDEIEIVVGYDKKVGDCQLDTTVQIKDSNGNYILSSGSGQVESLEQNTGKEGMLFNKVTLPANFFAPNEFYVNVLVVHNKRTVVIDVRDVVMFSVVNSKSELGTWMGKSISPLNVIFDWEINEATK